MYVYIYTIYIKVVQKLKVCKFCSIYIYIYIYIYI